jgi:6-phosphogluconolactonase (cycloisomerase 2 family)
MDEPRAITITPDGAHVYVAAGNYVVVFGRNAATGELSFIAAHSNGPPVGFGVSRPDAPVVSPDGKHLYVTGQESLAVFERNAGSGLLTLVEVEVDGVGGVDGIADSRAMAMSPDGANVYVTGFADDAVAVFARDPVSGALTFVQVFGDMDGAWPVVVSPGGAHVYIAGRGAMWAFARDAATGALSLIGAWETGVAAQGLALSGDGAHLYLSDDVNYSSGLETGPIRAFARDADTGMLTPWYRLPSLGRPFVTPDGAHVRRAGSRLWRGWGRYRR